MPLPPVMLPLILWPCGVACGEVLCFFLLICMEELFCGAPLNHPPVSWCIADMGQGESGILISVVLHKSAFDRGVLCCTGLAFSR